MEAKLTKDFINVALDIVTGDRQKKHGDKAEKARIYQASSKKRT